MRTLIALAMGVALLLGSAGIASARRPPEPLTVTPAIVHVGDAYTVSGPAPLYPDGTAKVNLCNPGCLIAFAAHWEDGMGTFTQVAHFPGTYVARFIGVLGNGKLYAASEVQFTVVP